MDERWESEIIEYGAINITGFRILDTHKRYVKEFLDGWKKLDATTSPGAGKEQISVRENGKKPRFIENYNSFCYMDFTTQMNLIIL